MIKTLNYQKKRLALMISLALMLTIGSVKAYAQEYWIYMLPNEETVIGEFVWFFKGDRVYYEWQNTGSTHGVGFGVYYFDGQSSQLMSNKTAGSGNGGAWASFTAPYTGNYFLKANCGGNKQTGCIGQGYIED